MALCPALADVDDLCCVHAKAHKIEYAMNGLTCQLCHKAIKTGEWLSGLSTTTRMIHAVCERATQRKKAAETFGFMNEPPKERHE